MATVESTVGTVGDAQLARLERPGRLSVGERRDRGDAVRRRVPHESLGLAARPADRADPVAILERQAATRIAELVPVRYGRMVGSPFAFYRGAAAVMASDLAPGPTTGLVVQLCGDAHLANFGVYLSPERRLVFDCNDFDETLPGPFEWDVKRLAASIEIAGRANGLPTKSRRTVVRAGVAAYREHMTRLAALGNLAVFYSDIGYVGELAELSRQLRKRRRKVEGSSGAKAGARDHVHAYKRLTTVVDGERRIVSDPPLVVPVDELVDLAGYENFARDIDALFEAYADVLAADVRYTLGQFRFVQLARKVVGVGSVGTRAWIALLAGRDESDPLFLQFKEAQASVLEEFLGRSDHEHHGTRVVRGQRIMQASSDVFLGWLRSPGVADGVVRDYYVRQLRDGKYSLRIDLMDAKDLGRYAAACASALARAHACSGDRVAIAAYLGDGSSFDDVIAEFAAQYADRNDADHAALRAAIDAGTVTAVEGV